MKWQLIIPMLLLIACLGGVVHMSGVLPVPVNTLKSSPREVAMVHTSDITKENKLKWEALKPERDGLSFKHTSKLTGPIVTAIKNLSPSTLPGVPFTLRGIVTVSQPLPSVVVKWKMPAGAQIIAGTEEYVLALEAGESKEFEIQVVVKGEENQQIHFIADGQIGESPFSDISQYNTRDQAEINESQLALKKRTLEYANDKQEKIFH